MIISKLMGGHSNQLFQYAVGRRLATKHNTDLLLDISWFDELAPTDTPRFYELGSYPVKAKTTKLKGLPIHDHHGPIPTKAQLKRRLGLDKDIWTVYEEGQGFHPEILKAPDNIELVGYWQCERYFADIRPQLLTELEPKTALTAKNKTYLSQIKKSRVGISLHVRREDYVTNKGANAFHGVLGADYYKRAVKHITDTIGTDGVELFIFCKEIDWCKQNLRFDLPVTFIEGNTLGCDDMRLMKHCQHFVMANSSFSWWGAWLSQSPDKIVVAPKRWFQDETADNAIDIIPGGWVRL